MNGIFFKGDVKDVCKRLESCKGMTVYEFIERRKIAVARLETIEYKQIEALLRRRER